MGYSNKKGWIGQEEVKTFLENVFSQQGFKFFNVNGSERSKKVLAGDVIIDRKSDKNDECVLNKYFIEVKKMASPSVFSIIDKATDDARWWGLRDYIAFISRSPRGEVTTKKDRIVVMSWDTFKSLMEQLQGYESEQSSKSK